MYDLCDPKDRPFQFRDRRLYDPGPGHWFRLWTNIPLMHQLSNTFHIRALHQIKLFRRHKYRKQAHSKI